MVFIYIYIYFLFKPIIRLKPHLSNARNQTNHLTIGQLLFCKFITYTYNLGQFSPFCHKHFSNKKIYQISICTLAISLRRQCFLNVRVCVWRVGLCCGMHIFILLYIYLLLSTIQVIITNPSLVLCFPRCIYLLIWQSVL